jgi:hypothetical protein
MTSSKTVAIERKPTTFLLPARDLVAVWNAVSTEEARYYLQGAFVESLAAGGARMTCLAVGILLTAEIGGRAFIGPDVLTQTGEHGGGFILKLDIGDKAFKVKPTFGEIWLYGDTETGIIQALEIPKDKDLDAYPRVGVVEFGRIDGTFPDWRRIMPKTPEGDACAPVVVNLDLLDSMRKAAVIYADRRGTYPVRITAGRAGEAMQVDFRDAPHLTGVVMPMRF